tara:strand:+ start:424 stop:792 length:369 start_codon:yes stop_codon:yes gene_type:complete
MSTIRQGKLFLILGFFNFVITNATLQIFLIFFPIWISTFFSQILNLIFGYFAYGKYVFKNQLRKKNIFFKYLILALFNWYLNSIMILIFVKYFRLSPNLSALINIPILTAISFFVQKYYVFR